MNLGDEVKREIRNEYPSHGKMDESAYGWFSLPEGRQSSVKEYEVYGGVGGGVMYQKKDSFGRYVFYQIYVKTRTDKLMIEIQPWNGTGSDSYNVGHSKITFKL